MPFAKPGGQWRAPGVRAKSATKGAPERRLRGYPFAREEQAERGGHGGERGGDRVLRRGDHGAEPLR